MFRQLRYQGTRLHKANVLDTYKTMRHILIRINKYQNNKQDYNGVHHNTVPRLCEDTVYFQNVTVCK